MSDGRTTVPKYGQCVRVVRVSTRQKTEDSNLRRVLLCRLWWYETVARAAEIEIDLFILVLVGK